jgi:alanyl-tRNA synthetase
MSPTTGSEIREAFLRFFEERGHRIVPSSSLIPSVPGLLLANAGMNQFVPYFLGHEQPPYPRAASSQKCMRTPDIENVGHDARHLTFFEMLGNFSFGDYFKREAISWAHELVTERYGIDHDRLWVTVFESDQDAERIWIEEAGIPAERIVRRGKLDRHGEPGNFWWMHAAGPCGPCSEIYVDRGPRYGPEGGPDVDEERFLEIWNLVFMQDECDEHSNVIHELPRTNIDTGSSLERVAMVLQDVDSVFETDLLRPLVETAESLTGRTYGKDDRADVSLRIIAEHGRAVTFLIADGVLPSNEGRGYVLRRMLRRLVTHARRLGVGRPVMAELVAATVEGFGQTYLELETNRPFVLQVASSEEEHFDGTYRQGIQLLEQELEKAKAAGSHVLSGDVAFRLHDTFGFQEQLTIELAADEGLAVETERFSRLMDEQRARAREAAKKGDVAERPLGEIAQTTGPSEFLGYQDLAAEGRVMGLVLDGERRELAGEGSKVHLVLDRTPFYAEGGGQVGDAGTIRTAGGIVQVGTTRPGPGGTIVHEGIVERGEVRQGEVAEAAVDAERRAATTRSHTGTHVLHHTLRNFLGEHARQAGSLVAPGRLRFDFTHFEAVPRDALEEVEYLSNRRLADDSPVRAYETTFAFARSQGAIALFGEKYGDLVRVVEIGDYSVELCGGTHVHHTGEVALLRVVSEGSIGAGFRRVEALVGPDALKQVNVERRLLEEVMEAVGAGDPAAVPERVRQTVQRIKQLESELGKLRRAEQAGEADALAAKALSLDGDVKLVVERVQGVDESALRELAARVGSKLAGGTGRAAVVLGTAGERGARLVASITGGLASRLSARQLLEPAAKAIGGGAGGKDTLAMAGGPRGRALDEALGTIPARLSELLAGA